MIDKLTIQRVLDAANVVDVISDFYELRKSGVNYTCLCPFHDDRHLGNFSVNREKNCYTCFSCKAHGNSVNFLMEHEKLSYPDAIRWLGKKYSIEVEGSERFNPKPCAPRKPTPPRPMLVLDKEKYMYPTLKKENNFTRWLRGLSWSDEQRARIDNVLNCYLVGTSKRGHVIFWQVDDQAQCLTGHMMMYDNNGHRRKTAEGKSIGNNWIHSVLFNSNVTDPVTGEVHPIFDQKKVKEAHCLFGLHLIDAAMPPTVNIVESEKTAIICSIMYGGMRNQLWLALAGKNNLKREKLQPLIDRGISIVLYPDKDATEECKEAAKEIGYKHLIVNDSFMSKYWKPEDGEKADIADVLIRMVRESAVGKAKQFLKDNPAVGLLANKLELELINISNG